MTIGHSVICWYSLCADFILQQWQVFKFSHVHHRGCKSYLPLPYWFLHIHKCLPTCIIFPDCCCLVISYPSMYGLHFTSSIRLSKPTGISFWFCMSSATSDSYLFFRVASCCVYYYNLLGLVSHNCSPLMFFITITITYPVHVSARMGHHQVESIYCLISKELFFLQRLRCSCLGYQLCVCMYIYIYIHFLFWRFFFPLSLCMWSIWFLIIIVTYFNIKLLH
jgi:hypothetical protein